MTFDIATQNNTAITSNSDYVAKGLTNQIIPAGETTYAFAVIVNGDNTIEPDETFFVNVTNAAGATISDGQGIGTIQNDDLPSLSIGDVSANEGDSGTTTFHFVVNLSAPALAGGDGVHDQFLAACGARRQVRHHPANPRAALPRAAAQRSPAGA